VRIVTGEARGRRLAVPRGREVRPTSDRAREGLFSALGDRVADARVLDLFAGTGALGLEALSRGAASAVFVERSRRVLEVLLANIAATGMGDRSTVMPIAAAAALGRLSARGASFDLVFLDPPYESGDLDAALAAIVPSSLVARGGRIIAEHPKSRVVSPTPPLRVVASRSYGGTALTTLAAEEEDH